MKYLFALSTIVLLFVSSCKKEEMEPCPSPPIKEIPNYMPLAIGNYWVYNDYKVDTLGNETKMNYVDSIYIQRDTLINNETYFVIEGNYSPYANVEYILRDSLGYLIDNRGEIKFSVTNFTDTLYSVATMNNNDTIIFEFKNMDPSNHSISVPAGTFSTLDYVRTFIFPYQPPYTQRKFHKYNAEGVGTILETWGYAAATTIFEKRLIKYHVEK